MPKKALNHIGYFLFLIFPMAILMTGFPRVVAAEPIFKLDFGKVRPFKETVIERILPVEMIREKADEIMVDYDPSLKDPLGHNLPVSRLKMAVNDELFELKNFDSPINLTRLSSNQKLYRFMFLLELAPADLPGRYNGTVLIKYRTGTTWRKISILLTVEIQPWVRIEASRSNISLDQAVNDDAKLQSLIPFTVRIASNSNWTLYLKEVKSAKTETNIPWQVTLNPRPSANKIQLISSTEIISEKERKALAIGNATVSETHWVEIDLVFFLPEFIKYPAGTHTFHLQFIVEFWDHQPL